MFGPGDARETVIELQWGPVLMRPASVEFRKIRHGCDSIWFRVKMHTLILKTVILGGSNDALMHNVSGVFSQDFKSHGIPNFGSNTNPPSCFFFGGTEGLVRIEIENPLVEMVFQKSRDVL